MILQAEIQPHAKLHRFTRSKRKTIKITFPTTKKVMTKRIPLTVMKTVMNRQRRMT